MAAPAAYYREEACALQLGDVAFDRPLRETRLGAQPRVARIAAAGLQVSMPGNGEAATAHRRRQA
jgi:hypothetical protein